MCGDVVLETCLSTLSGFALCATDSCLSVATLLLAEPAEPAVHLAAPMHARTDLISMPCSYSQSIVLRFLV